MSCFNNDKYSKEELREIHISAKTAIHRSKPALPTRKLAAAGKLTGTILNLGKGKSTADAEFIKSLSASYFEYDPNFAQDETVIDNRRYDTVISNYVLNVLPESVRHKAWLDIRDTTGGTAYITVRGKGDRSLKGVPEGDGVRTSIGTFQKPFSPAEIVKEAARYFTRVTVIYGSERSPFITISATNAIDESQAAFEQLDLFAI